MTAPADVQEFREWATRVEEEYRERFGESIQTEMISNPYEAAERALDSGEPISYPEPPPGADF